MKFFQHFIFVALSFFVSCAAKAPTHAYSGHGALSVPKEVIQKFAPPPLPYDINRRVQAIIDVRAPGLGKVHPNGKSLFFNWNITGMFQVWRVDGPKGFPIQMTGGSDLTVLGSITPDGRYLVLSRDRNGEENPGLYLQPAQGGELVVIQHKPGIQTSLEFVSDDSRYIYFSSNDLKPDSYAIYRYEISTSKIERIFDQDGIWGVADWKNDGTLLLEKHTGSIWKEYSEFNPETRKVTPLLGQGEKEEYFVSYGARDGEFLVLTPKFGEFRQLYRMRDGKFQLVTPVMNHDVSEVMIDRPRKRIVYEINEAGYTRVAAMDARTWAPLSLPKFNADLVFLGSTTRDGRYLTLGVDSSKGPMTSYVYDWQTGKLMQWILPSAPEFDTTQFVPATLEYYPARDGTKIPMFVRRPKQCKSPCPAVVHFHGGPEGQSVPGFSPRAQLFLDAGFVLVDPNVRGSDGYGKTWLNSDNGPKRLEVVTDIEDCARFIRSHWRQGNAAPKVGIMGGSYGGYSTLAGMTMFAGAYDAGVALVGMSNLVTFLQNTAPYRRMLRATEYGDPEKDKEALIKLSPVTYIDRVKDPLLMIQGISDPRVPAGEAIQMYEILKGKKIPAELILFADEGHGAKKRDNQVLEIGHTLQFFQKHLQSEKSGS